MKLTKYDYSSLKKTQKKPKAKPKIPLTSHDLDTIDDVANQVLSETAESKLHLLRLLEESYERVKEGFVRNLDRATDLLREVITKSSKYAFLEAFVSDFYDKQSELELNESPETLETVCDHLQKLFNLDDFMFYRKLVDVGSLPKLLDRFEKLFVESAKDYPESENYRTFEIMLGEFTIQDTSIGTYFEIGQMQSDAIDSASGAKSIWDKHPQILNLRLKLSGPRAPGVESDLKNPDCLSMRIFQALWDSESKGKYYFATPMVKNKGTFLFFKKFNRNEVNPDDYTSIVNYRGTKRETACDPSDELEGFSFFEVVNIFEPHWPLVRFKVRFAQNDVLISPSDDFIAFLMEAQNNWVVCRIQPNTKSIEQISLDKFKGKFVQNMTFVDYPKREKLVFVDEGFDLVVFDLLEQKIEFELAGVGVRSVHYLGPNSIFLVAENLDMGIFSLRHKTMSNWVLNGYERGVYNFFDCSPGTFARYRWPKHALYMFPEFNQKCTKSTFWRAS